ncbi:MAG: hypothetical protein AAGB00_03140 [Planctomycetota bacterium]
MPARQPIDEATREQLVAYLDGELPDADCEAIESRLATEDALRDQLQGLDRVWNALDGLPRPQVDDSFARTTIEMAAVEAQCDVAAMTAALPVKRRRRGYAVAGACVGAALLGFALVRSAVTTPDRVLVNNLPVIYRVDTLQDVSGPDFLRRLPTVAEPLLAGADSEQVAADAAAWIAVGEGDRAARLAWVNNLADGEKAKLLDAARRYTQELTPTRRQRAGEVYASIAGAQDRAALMTTAIAYQSWLTTQPASEQTRLRRLNDDARLEELGRLARDAARQTARSLPQPDAAALRAAVKSLEGSPEFERAKALGRESIERIHAFVTTRSLQPDQQERVDRFRERMLAGIQKASPLELVIRLAQITGQSGRTRRMPFSPDLGDGQEAAALWADIEAKLVGALSEPTQRTFNRIDNPSRRREQLLRWVQQATRDADSFDLEEYFASPALTDQERHALLAMPADVMQRRLRQIYVKRELGGFEQNRLQDVLREVFGGRRGGTPADDAGGRGRRGGPGARGGRRGFEPGSRPEGGPTYGGPRGGPREGPPPER